MLIFLRQNLTYLAAPKTGTTAVEVALKPQAEIVFARSRKHTTAARYAKKVAPFLQDTFGVSPPSVAVMRDPVDQIRSWYKYRGQPKLAGTPVSTQDISFDDFVLEVISDNPPERAGIGRQFSFLTDGAGQIMADHIFSYAHQADFVAFLSDRLAQPVDLTSRNVSPTRDAEIGADALVALKQARAEDFDLYDRILAAGGYITKDGL